MFLYKAQNLRVENLENPICIDLYKPKFSWIIVSNINGEKQTAYRIIVSDSIENIKNNIGNLWDSGKVHSNKNYEIEYDGIELKSFTEYFWAIEWWNKDDCKSELSDIANFSTALLKSEDWVAKWITKDFEKNKEGLYSFGRFEGDINFTYATYYRKDFEIRYDNIKQAKAFICGLGYYELRLNGKKVGDNVLDSPQSDYNKTVYYTAYDIKDLLQNKNAFGVILGNGRYIKSYGYDYPKFILQVMIEYVNGDVLTLISDEEWKVNFGPLRENGLYFGEFYDARLEMEGWDEYGYNDKNWEKPIIKNGSKLIAQKMPPIKIDCYLKPQRMFNPSHGVFVFDFGQNFSGWVKLIVEGPCGTKVQLRFAENIDENYMINTQANIHADATDIYILKGKGIEIYEPRFTYHGFRYVEVTGYPGVPSLDNVIGCFVHTSVKKNSYFYCSNELINKIHQNILWSQLSNLMSIPTDCPQRNERQGWMGDAALSCEEAIFNFDMINFYKKYLQDIKDSQFEDGSLTDISPFYLKHLHPADPAWGTAYITIVYNLYKYYDDIGILKEHYTNLKKYINYLNSISDDGIIYKIGKFGDWCPPGSVVPKNTSIEFTSTWYFIHDVLLLSEISKVLNENVDYEKFRELYNNLVDKFNKKFLNDGFYESVNMSRRPKEHFPAQTSFALPLYLEMVPENVKQKTLNYFLESVIKNHDYHVDTGIIGTRFLFDVLSKYGYDEVAYKVINQKSYPGYGYMILEGATTLWERWEKLTNGAMNSHNHIMFGSVDTWFFKNIVGVNCLEPGWSKIGIYPKTINDIKFACGIINTIRGKIECSWQRDNTNFKLNVKIPVNAIGNIKIPFVTTNKIIKFFDTEIEYNNPTKNNYFKILNIYDKEIELNLESGYYEFISQ